MIIPNKGKNKNVPNHQPDLHFYPFWSFKTSANCSGHVLCQRLRRAKTCDCSAWQNGANQGICILHQATHRDPTSKTVNHHSTLYLTSKNNSYMMSSWNLIWHQRNGLVQFRIFPDFQWIPCGCFGAPVATCFKPRQFYWLQSWDSTVRSGIIFTHPTVDICK